MKYLKKAQIGYGATEAFVVHRNNEGRPATFLEGSDGSPPTEDLRLTTESGKIISIQLWESPEGIHIVADGLIVRPIAANRVAISCE